MSLQKVGQKPLLDSIEKAIRIQGVTQPVMPSARELLITFFGVVAITPFFLTTVFVLPIMGQIVGFVAAATTVMYMVARRSWLVAVTMIGGFGTFSILTLLVIQAVKTRVDIPLFIFLAMGVPILLIYSVILGAQIWALKGGGD